MKKGLASVVTFLALGCAGLVCADVRADEPENAIFGSGWGMTLALDGTGFYNDLMRFALAAGASDKPYLPLPYKRAKVEFAKNGASCLYPARIEHLLRGKDIRSPDAYVESLPLVFVESHIFSRPAHEPLESFSGLEGKLVAYPNGSALPNFLGEYNATFVPTTDETTKARMLIAGRVDHMSGSLPDNIFVFQSLGAPLPPYNPDLAILRIGVGVVCHRTPENEAFVRALDRALATPVARAELVSLYRKLGVDERFLPRHGGEAAEP